MTFGAVVARLAASLAALWAGVLVALGAIAAPALFATLPVSEAGRIAGRLFEEEAYGSVVVGALILVAERARHRRDDAGPQFGVEFALALGVIFTAVAGQFAVQPLMEAARAGRGPLSFGALHAISAGFFVLRGLLLLALAWRLTAPSRLGGGLRPSTTS